MAKKENTKTPKHEPSSKLQAYRTAANKQKNIERDLKDKQRAAWKKARREEKQRFEAERRGAHVVALPDKHAEEIVRRWKARKMTEQRT